MKLYIYDIKDGAFVYADTGEPESILRDLGDNKDFTLQEPPHYDNEWYWVGDKWQDKPAQ